MSKFWCVILFTLSFLGCSEPEPVVSETLVLGHGGMGFPSALNQYPPNTWESADRAFAEGAHGVELDVQLSEDSVVMLYHDKSLETQVSESGSVARMKAAELEGFKYFGQNLHPDISIQKAEDVLARAAEKYGARVFSLNIQLPDGTAGDQGYRDRFARGIVRLIEQFKGMDFFIESERMDYLEAIKSLAPDTERYLIGSFSPENLAFMKEHGAKGLVTNYSAIEPPQARELRDNGLKLMIFGLKIRRDIVRSMNLIPDAVQTDNIPLTFSIYGIEN